MEGSEWKKAAQESDLREGIPVPVTIDEKEVMLVRVNGSIHACGNECTHYGGVLTDGVLKDGEVTCPLHNARFDATTGRMLAAPALNDLPRYETKTEKGTVYIRPEGSVRISMPEGKDNRTFVIVGAGASGNAAAEMLRREGFSGRILMITAEKDRPYDRTMLSKDYLAGDAPAKWLPLRGEKFYDRLQIELMTGRRVQSLDPGTKTLTLQDETSVSGDRILIATGGTPRTLNIPGTGLKGCHYLRSLQDCERIITGVEQAEQAVVLGASFIGLEVAASLRKRDRTVHVVAPEQIPLTPVFGERIGRWVQHRHTDKGVRFHLAHTVKEIRGDGRVREVVLDDDTRIKTDLIIIGVGILPAVDFLSGSGLVEKGEIPVDSRFRTGVEGIYACGDIAAIPDPVTGEIRRVEHWVEAERQGQHAARAMLDSPEPYSEIPFFWTRQYGKSLKYIGYARRFDSVVFRGTTDDGRFIAGLYEKGALRAAAAAGYARELIAIGQMLKEGKNLDPERLSDPDFSITG